MTIFPLFRDGRTTRAPGTRNVRAFRPTLEDCEDRVLRSVASLSALPGNGAYHGRLEGRLLQSLIPASHRSHAPGAAGTNAPDVQHNGVGVVDDGGAGIRSFLRASRSTISRVVEVSRRRPGTPARQPGASRDCRLILSEGPGL